MVFVRPERLPDFLAADQGAFIFDQDAQYLERLFLEQDGRASGAQLPRLQVEAKGAEASAFWERFPHWKVSPVGEFHYWSLYHPLEFGVPERNSVSRMHSLTAPHAQ
jgi:hypothetical protein